MGSIELVVSSTARRLEHVPCILGPRVGLSDLLRQLHSHHRILVSCSDITTLASESDVQRLLKWHRINVHPLRLALSKVAVVGYRESSKKATAACSCPPVVWCAACPSTCPSLVTREVRQTSV